MPCDQAGENCPLQGALASGNRERVLHIHQTPRGREHVDVELLPLHDAKGKLKYFVELLKPVTVASPEVDRSNLVGNSAAFNAMLGKLMRVAPTDAAVLLLGESGSGKSVTALTIMGLLPQPPARIAAGKVMFQGQDLTKLSAREMQRIRGPGIAMIFQEPMTSLNPVFSIGDQIMETIRAPAGDGQREVELRMRGGGEHAGRMVAAPRGGEAI